MAGFGSSQTSGGGSYSAPAKQWTPPPQTPAVAGALAGARVGAAPAQAPAQAPQATGGAAVNAFKQTSTYVNSVLSVFKAQNPYQQQKIVAGAAQNPNTPESKAVLDYVKSTSQQGAASGAAAGAAGGTGVLAGTHAPQTQASAPISAQRGAVGDVGHFLTGIGLGTHAPTTQQFQQTYGGVAKAASGAVGSVFDLAHQLPLSKPIGTNEKVAAAAGSSSPDVAKNAAKDIVDFYAGAPSAIGTVAADTLKSPSKGLNDLLAQPKAILHDPAKAFIEHPFLSAMTVTGLVHGGSRALAAPVRAAAPASSAVGRLLSTQREPVQLTGNLTVPRPPYSKSPTVKLQQHSFEKYNYPRNPTTGVREPRTAAAAQQAIMHTLAGETSALERMRRVSRDTTAAGRVKAVTASVPARVAHVVATTLKPGAIERATIPGANVMSLAADRTIRTPQTWAADLNKYANLVESHLPEVKVDYPHLVGKVQDTIKSLRKSAAKPPSMGARQALFAAADKYANEFGITQSTAHQLGHYGGMTSDQLLKRQAEHYAIAHMGARIDSEAGLVQDRPRGNGNGTYPRPLPLQEIKQHMEGPQGTKGAFPAYTPDYPTRSSAFYIKSDRRPAPATVRGKTTGYAYTHGLTDISHQALLEHHVRTQGAIDAIRSQNHLAELLHVVDPQGYHWDYKAAEAAAQGRGLVPINMASPFYPRESLDRQLADVHPTTIDQELERRGFDLNARMQPGGPNGRWALIDPRAKGALDKLQQAAVPADALTRAWRGANSAWRQNVLASSGKHVPGVLAEQVIRDITHGIGVRSWLTGRRMMKQVGRQYGPQPEAAARGQLTGGMQVGSTQLLRTHTNPEAYADSRPLHAVAKSVDTLLKTPGPRQLATAWRTWTRFSLGTVRHMLEEQHNLADVGKHALGQHGYAEAARAKGALGLMQRMLGLHGEILQDATKGLLDQAKLREIRALQVRFRGQWTDFTPSMRKAIMFSPFGMWWVNSAKFLWHLPTDAPVKASALAAITASTQQQREKEGLTLWGKGHLPGYLQGTVPVNLPGPLASIFGTKSGLLAQNYYSPWGIANNPAETGASLAEPWALPLINGAAGLNGLFQQLSYPGKTGNPHGFGYVAPNTGQRAEYLLNSLLGAFLGPYALAQRIRAGGNTSYDVQKPFAKPQLVTKKGQPQPNVSLLRGVEKSLFPLRVYKPPATKQASGGLPKLPKLPELPKLPGLP